MSDPQEKIAIIGMACRFPGGCHDLDTFWSFLLNKQDAMTDVPPSRWDHKKFYHPNPDKPGKTYVKQAAFLDQDIKSFDPTFFGISPREAEIMDPLQRLLLEAAWEGIEDSGNDLKTLQACATGVFVGGFTAEHTGISTSSLAIQTLDSLSSTSVNLVMLSNKISYLFNLKGPSFTVDTACSSSLMAINLACRSLQSSDCDVALAGGVNVMLSPSSFIFMSKGHFLSEHGRSKMGSDDATGYARGEGVGIVVLKKLSQALKDGDRIHAVITAINTNQDGRTHGITLPSKEAQYTLIVDTLQAAEVLPSEVHYIEAHGTGTKAGDKTELSSITQAFRPNAEDEKIMIGSVKTNMGHLEAASGVAGMIKAVLCLKNQTIPPNLHFDTPNPDIDFSKIVVPTTVQKSTFSRVGINSFGYGGSNVFALLEAAPQQYLPTPTPPREGYRLVPITAHTQKALRDRIRDLHTWLLTRTETLDLDKLIFTLSQKRTALSHRLTFIVQSIPELLSQMALFLSDKTTDATYAYATAFNTPQDLVFVYTGMGPQWAGMGRELYASEPIFRQKVEDIDRVFSHISGWSIKEILLHGQPSDMQKTAVAQPANFVIQVALTALFEHYGVVPKAVIGHSVGEVAAAYVSGALSLEDALKVSFHRSRLQQTLAGQGGMLAVGLSFKDVTTYLKDFSHLEIAAINSPSNVTVAGDLEAIQAFSDLCTQKDIFNKQLKVEVAYHSFMMAPIEDQVMTALQDLTPQPTRIPMISTVTGKKVAGTELDAAYWWGNIRQPVNFEMGISTAMADAFRSFIEIGPHPVLKNSLMDIARDAKEELHLFQSLHMKSPEHITCFKSLGTLFCAGLPIDFKTCQTHKAFYDLPNYPWQREYLWRTPNLLLRYHTSLPGANYFQETIDTGTPMWKSELNEVFYPFLSDHIVNGRVVFPGAGYIDIALSLCKKLYPELPVLRLDNVAFDRMLIYEPNQITQLLTAFDAYTGEVSITSLLNPENPVFTHHATCDIVRDTQALVHPEAIDIQTLLSRMGSPIANTHLYDLLTGIGLVYGPTFQSIQVLYKGDKEALIELNTSYTKHPETVLAPPLLDGAIQSMLGVVGGELQLNSPFVPVSIERIMVFDTIDAACFCHTELKTFDAGKIICDLTLCDEKGKILAQIRGVKCQSIPANASDTSFEKNAYSLNWDPSEKPEISETKLTNRHWGLFVNQKSRLEAQILEQHLGKFEKRTFFVEAEVTQKVETDIFEINRLKSDEIKKIIQEESITDVLFCWGLEPIDSNAPLSHQIGELATVLGHVVDSLPEGASLTILTSHALGNATEPPHLGSGFGLVALPQLFENEYPHVKVRLVDLDDNPDSITQLQYPILSDGNECHLKIREGQFFKARLTRFETVSKTAMAYPAQDRVQAVFDKPGSISNLYFTQKERVAPQRGEVEIQIKSLGLNLKDALKIIGKLDKKATDDTYHGDAIGMELSGIISRVGPDVTQFKPGDEVMSLMTNHMGSFAVGPADFTTHKPPHMGFDESHIALTFIASYEGLVALANIQEGETVLIHNGTGGIGLSAIQIAQWKKAKVITTTSTKEKEAFLRDEYGVEHVFNSRSLSFTEDVLRVTEGAGVDVVLNALSGPTLFKSWELLKPFGRFIEIGKKDINDNSKLPMHVFNRSVSFFSIDIDLMVKRRPEKALSSFLKIRDFFLNKTFKPLPTTCFDFCHIHDAIKFLLESKHIGKVALTINDTPIETVLVPTHQHTLQKDKTYVITGGTSGFGLEVAKWLASQGAKHLLLLSRRGANTPHLAENMAFFDLFGTTVRVEALDITQTDKVQALLHDIEASGSPIGGIINGAMVLDDFAIRDVELDRMLSVLNPKIEGALAIMHAAKSLKALDFVIHFSSISSVIGNKNQLSYVVANGFLDQFSAYCRHQGIPSMTLNWGVLGEAGVVHRNTELAKILEFSGIQPYSNADAFRLLKQALAVFPSQIGLFDIRWGKAKSIFPALSQQAIFENFAISDENEFGDNAFIKVYLTCSETEKMALILNDLKDILAKITRSSADKVEPNAKLNELGIDSLMSVELVIAIQTHFSVRLSEMALLSNPSIHDLALILSEKLQSLLQVTPQKVEVTA